MHNYTTVKLLAFFMLFIIVGLIAASNADTLISPADSRINYYGRFDMTDPAKPTFNWSGAVIEAQFPGPTIGMKFSHLQDYSAYYDIEIDGVIDTVISCGSKQQFIFSTTLSPSMHILRIILRSEEHFRYATFQGLYLANGKQLADAPAKPVRKIEFIGDSYTAGYGIESPVRENCDAQLPQTTNANKAFPMLITKAFHAQSIILGWSGAGMVKNYKPMIDKRSEDPFPFYYGRTLGAADTKTWDFSKWIPDLVVICLGTNDYTSNRDPSSNPAPDDSMYIGDYHKFIARVLGNYPSTSILCVSTGDAKFEKNLKTVVTEEIKALGHPKVYFAAYPANLDNSGCDWHPSIVDNKKVAAVLVDTVMKKLSWDTTASTVILPPPGTNSHRSAEFTVASTASSLCFTLASGTKATLPFDILTIDGRKIARILPDKAGKCTVSTGAFSNGMYLVGNNTLGWKRVAVGTMR